MAERIVLTVEIELFKVDSRGVFPAVDDFDGWVELLAEFIDDTDGLPVCTDDSHTEDGICSQHISQMEDSEWRIASITPLYK